MLSTLLHSWPQPFPEAMKFGASCHLEWKKMRGGGNIGENIS